VKAYDRRYYERWYGGRKPVMTEQTLRRKARLALAAAEFALDREIRSVLDVGCGEGRWRAELKRLRPALTYVGVDGSEYVVRRFGARRGIRRGTLGTVGRLGLKRRFDLIVCSDVVQYVETTELKRGLVSLRRLAGGILYLDAATSDDDFDGDREQWQPRSARAYRRLFMAAGLLPCGLNCWLPRDREHLLTPLERGG
jgi:SAM-dependent methyltransferase